ncbi:MAG: prenyltransferase, partial [Bacteroides sp.]|nr:prenyltransferase [Bacteroides sp.]
VSGTFPVWGLLILPALAPAMMNVRVVSRFTAKGEAAIATLDEMTAKLQLLFSLLFALSFFIAGALA